MPLIIDEPMAEATSRITGIRVSLLTLRLMENWRRDIDDFECAMIMVAVVAIAGERLTRADLDDELKDLRQVFPAELLPKCNISSIAAATGLNRETARRKVNQLIHKGLLARAEDGTVRFPSGLVQQETTWKLIRKQLDAIVRTANDMVRDGVVKSV